MTNGFHPEASRAQPPKAVTKTAAAKQPAAPAKATGALKKRSSKTAPPKE